MKKRLFKATIAGEEFTVKIDTDKVLDSQTKTLDEISYNFEMEFSPLDADRAEKAVEKANREQTGITLATL